MAARHRHGVGGSGASGGGASSAPGAGAGVPGVGVIMCGPCSNVKKNAMLRRDYSTAPTYPPNPSETLEILDVQHTQSVGSKRPITPRLRVSAAGGRERTSGAGSWTLSSSTGSMCDEYPDHSLVPRRANVRLAVGGRSEPTRYDYENSRASLVRVCRTHSRSRGRPG